VKRIRKMGLLSGIVVLVICELPWLLALLGFGALSLNLEKLPMMTIELTGIALVLLSAVLWLFKHKTGRIKV